MTEETDPVIYSVADGVAQITLNRPEKRNALNEALILGVTSALNTAQADEQVRVVIISGAGKDFCSGADLAALQKIASASVAENVDDARQLLNLFLLIRSLRIPVIAAVRGRALAGGCGLATACDLVLASDSARFGYPEVKIGFVPAMVMSILRRNVSEKRAFELITRGTEISASEAFQIGLVNQMFPDATFDQMVTEYAQGFQKLSSSAITLTKQLLYQIDGQNFTESIQAGLDLNVIARMTAACKKGIARFLRKE
jgi:methylglutaconyl-CoA hydratase